MKGMTVLLALLFLLPAMAAPNGMMRLRQPGCCSKEMSSEDAGIDPYFVPEDIRLADDGFHEELPLHAETWYYEALFDGRSMVFIVTLLSLPDGQSGLARAGLYLYRDGRLVGTERMATASFRAALDRPRIRLDGTPVIEGCMNEKGDLAYDVNFDRNEHAISLHFVNRTKGWMGDLGRGWWLAVPNLKVTGTITVNGSSHAVAGTGYHDHNVFSLLNPLLECGYLDGKMTSEHFSLVWGHILESRTLEHSFAVLSEGGTYLAVGPDAMDISFSSYVWDNGSRIPTACTVSIHHEKHGLTGKIWMNATTMHHIRLPLLRYWRYHTEVTGWLCSPSHRETINQPGIMECMLY